MSKLRRILVIALAALLALILVSCADSTYEIAVTPRDANGDGVIDKNELIGAVAENLGGDAADLFSGAAGVSAADDG